jgi:hypothetical protein
MAQTCKTSIIEVFKEAPGPLSTAEVIELIYKKNPTRPWKENTIRDHLIGLSVNHPSGKHHPNLQKHAFLHFMGNGIFRCLEETLENINKVGTTSESYTAKEINVNVDNEIIEDQYIQTEKSSINENQFMALVLNRINAELIKRGINEITTSQGSKLPYAYEILSYDNGTPAEINDISYETDLLVYETTNDQKWKPRVVIEGKLGSVTTHDAITYSQKALTHKNVHPYLRYGILLGDRKHYPLPGRLFRHGAYFDFMLSSRSTELSADELEDLVSLIIEEVEASRNLEEILYNSRNPNRKKFTLLHKPLKLR